MDRVLKQTKDKCFFLIQYNLHSKLTFLPLLGAILRPTVGAGTSTSLEKNWNLGVKESRCEKQKNLRTKKFVYLTKEKPYVTYRVEKGCKAKEKPNEIS